ncbi:MULTISPECIES: formate/nitrite transporter family protein [unclassified Leeuwenhoekiella]|uniref:formate/nitrite transporter family protein n=1 Tax=unclassified Leeuwenhoekiella TaxID=2615029 RepID=UPI000C492C3D|nr:MULTISPECIES: formate/nitrite transporter family protein [unclassified Leeuwenhoekiella]MAW95285.1 formate transporter [Leeuwenhoekiella sp.]MBA81792.1 formate transporter [Leeuwenhoekiella sp.]|tara:strand:- start:4287 stop:5141 length:855 start_codon:yes stop_codon:yes gene_type:complete
MSEEEEKKQENIDQELEKAESSEVTQAKSHGEILKEQICEGQEIYDRSTSSILMSSLTAGLEIGFSYLLMCSMFYYYTDKIPEEGLFKILAFVYPLGFILVVLGQSILFTEQTSLLTLPVLNRQRDLWSLLRLWGLVIVGNLIGGFLMGLLLIWIGPQLGIFDHATIIAIGTHVADYDGLVILVSALLAGWMMGLLSWLITSSKDTISRIVIIFIITATMAFTGLHHSIIGNIEVFSAFLAGPEVTFTDYLRFQSLALLGNAIGGAFFVALLKYRAFVFNVSDY